MNPLTLLLWLATHWWVLAIIAALVIAGLVYSSILPLAKVIAAFFKACAAVVEFFTEPKEQIAAKVLCCIAFFCFGAAPGFYYGKHVVNSEWAAADAKAEKDRKDLDKKIGNEAAKNAEAAEQRISELEAKMNAKEAANEKSYPACTIDEPTAERLRNER